MNRTGASNELVIDLIERQIEKLEREHLEELSALRTHIARLRTETVATTPALPVQAHEFEGLAPGEAIHAYLKARPSVPVSYKQLTEDLTAGGLPMLTKVKKDTKERSVFKERLRLVRIALGNNRNWLRLDEENETVMLGQGGPYRRTKRRGDN